MDSSVLLNLLSLVVSAVFSWWVPVVSTSETAGATTTAMVRSVIDGDTIIVDLAGQTETVRYIGIDTPEPRREGVPECGSHEATEYNRELVAGKTVRLVADTEDRDQYHRLLRYVYVDREGEVVFVNQKLIEAGLAVPLTITPNTIYAGRFVSYAQRAETERVGNWEHCIK